MTFSENYTFEVLQSRRIRRQRALFWAKILSFMLMILVAVTLRSEPQLRMALFTAVTDAGMRVMGKTDQAVVQTDESQLSDMLQNPDLKEVMQAAPMQFTAPPSEVQAPATRDNSQGNRIKVNRPGAASGTSTTFKRVVPPSATRPTRPLQDGQIGGIQGTTDALQGLMQDLKISR
ncbi:hypothetical protein Z945_3343 [Sulfitobacter noctilucae]|uniref:hypothetical protein n=1 Tax=Sulfitobacter noctilucae TaxID=1342302 RepID=UPI000468F573|nr:hypothetical protein [Sulfitobacter noctilucae]KIN70879.1 hypothetical protein Z945_3343 [Sulfitobacter noctilucae]